MFRLLHGDVLSFCQHYQGEKFHALLCDPPYHLTSIVERFGKPESAPAKHGKDGAFQRASRGFMGKEWDGGDIAFRPETWYEIGKLLYPGAFGMAFGGSRTAHRMAVAIEDAGFIIHPMIGWVYGSGFPKATRVKNHESFDGHRYGTQALKPALEPIIVFQKPYEGKPVENIVETGAGALNIEGGRIGVDPGGADDSRLGGKGEWRTDKAGKQTYDGGWSIRGKNQSSSSQGRWPANFQLTHSPDCQIVGYKDQEGYQINRFTDGAKPFGDGAGHEYESEEIEGGKIPVWDCADGCPAKALDEQSGILTSGAMKKHYEYTNTGSSMGKPAGKTRQIHDKNSGGASRFFHQSSWAFENADPFAYQAKVSPSERNAGLSSEPEQLYGQSGGARQALEEGEEEYLKDHIGLNVIKKVRNPHPTLKPISLCTHLATLLLPPEEYAPRRILVPFAGVASEMIGAFQAGWNCAVGVELEKEYVNIGKQRIDYWLSQGVQLSLL